MAKNIPFPTPTARIIDTLPWETLLSIVPMLDKSNNEDVQHLVSDLVAEVRTKLFQEMPVVEEKQTAQDAQGGKVLSFDGGTQKPN